MSGDFFVYVLLSEKNVYIEEIKSVDVDRKAVGGGNSK